MDSHTFIAQTEEKSRMMQAKTFDIPTVSVKKVYARIRNLT